MLRGRILFLLFFFEIFYYTYIQHIEATQPWENHFKERGADGWMNEGINEW